MYISHRKEADVYVVGGSMVTYLQKSGSWCEILVSSKENLEKQEGLHSD